MSTHEKIRFLRQAKGWTQEEVAAKLEMSLNGYGSIERGETNVSLARLEQISNLFEIKLSDLFADEKITFNQSGTKNKNIQNYCATTTQSTEYLQLKTEYEKRILLNEAKDKEIAYLKEIIELMKNKSDATDSC